MKYLRLILLFLFVSLNCYSYTFKCRQCHKMVTIPENCYTITVKEEPTKIDSTYSLCYMCLTQHYKDALYLNHIILLIATVVIFTILIKKELIK